MRFLRQCSRAAQYQRNNANKRGSSKHDRPHGSLDRTWRCACAGEARFVGKASWTMSVGNGSGVAGSAITPHGVDHATPNVSRQQAVISPAYSSGGSIGDVRFQPQRAPSDPTRVKRQPRHNDKSDAASGGKLGNLGKAERNRDAAWLTATHHIEKFDETTVMMLLSLQAKKEAE
jgi:hypothetical protein